MRRSAVWALAVFCLFGLCALLATAQAAEPAKDVDPAQQLAKADRLACAFAQGVTAGFNPQGRASIKPPLDPNTPGLSIQIADREKHRAMLEEDDRETAGIFLLTPTGLTIMARYPDGGAAMVTVYPVYSGASDNFLMVMSKHDAATTPTMSQRYGLCRLGADPSAAPPPAPAPKDGGHGHQ